jgi:hypothetical protein
VWHHPGHPCSHQQLTRPSPRSRELRAAEVIKFGLGVTEKEAENQKRAYLLVDHNIVRVPCVYRFFNDNSGLGYIIMEYMPGKVIEPLEDSTRIDIAPRNILWQEDGSLCLVDWASAGYYPRIFEFCAQWIIEGKEGKFNKLLDSMESLSDRELAQKVSILRAWRNSQNTACQCLPEFICY